MKIQNKIFFGGGGGWGWGCRVREGGGVKFGGQGGCERRSEAFVKMEKNFLREVGGGGDGRRVWRGVTVDENGEVKFL